MLFPNYTPYLCLSSFWRVKLMFFWDFTMSLSDTFTFRDFLSFYWSAIVFIHIFFQFYYEFNPRTYKLFVLHGASSSATRPTVDFTWELFVLWEFLNNILFSFRRKKKWRIYGPSSLYCIVQLTLLGVRYGFASESSHFSRFSAFVSKRVQRFL